MAARSKFLKKQFWIQTHLDDYPWLAFIDGIITELGIKYYICIDGNQKKHYIHFDTVCRLSEYYENNLEKRKNNVLKLVK